MESRTPKVDSKTPENQCCAATVEEMCAVTLGHYDDISTKVYYWSNQVPQAIKFWYLEKPNLERALAAAEQELKAWRQHGKEFGFIAGRFFPDGDTYIIQVDAALARGEQGEEK